MKHYASKVIEAGKKAAFVAKNADSDKIADVQEELRNANDANQREHKARKAPGTTMTDTAFGKKAAEANQRYRDAASVAIGSAHKNKPKGY